MTPFGIVGGVLRSLSPESRRSFKTLLAAVIGDIEPDVGVDSVGLAIVAYVGVVHGDGE